MRRGWIYLIVGLVVVLFIGVGVGLYQLGGADKSALERLRDIAVIYIVFMSVAMVLVLAAVTVAFVMLTLTLVVTLGELTSGWGTGALFFIGLGLTFALVALMPTPEGRMQWAWIPAGILLLMGGLILAAAEELIGIIGPVALIVSGLFLFYQAVRPRQQL